LKPEADLNQKFLLLVIANVLNVVLIYLSVIFIHSRYSENILLACIMSGFVLNLALILGFLFTLIVKRSFWYVALLIAFACIFIGDDSLMFKAEWFAIQVISTLIGIFILGYKSFLPFKEKV
jgi:hypothetical protein